MGFIKRIGTRVKNNLLCDFEHLRGEGGDQKADIIYRRIKAFFSGSWNILIDKMVSLLLKSASRDVEVIIRECKSAGLDPIHYFPSNLKDKLTKSYSM